MLQELQFVLLLLVDSISSSSTSSPMVKQTGLFLILLKSTIISFVFFTIKMGWLFLQHATKTPTVRCTQTPIHHWNAPQQSSKCLWHWQECKSEVYRANAEWNISYLLQRTSYCEREEMRNSQAVHKSREKSLVPSVWQASENSLNNW